MALEPAGVSLQAEGFDKYIKNLQTIDKTQRKVFDAKFKDTNLSFQQVTKAAKDYEKQLKDLDRQQKKSAQSAQSLAQQEQIAANTRRQAILSTGNAVLDIAKQVATFSFESAQLAAQFEGQSTGLTNLAASFGQSGKQIQNAIQTASRGAVSGLEAITIANQGLLLGVAQTPAEFETLTKSAITLGRAVGLNAERSIERFTVGIGRQSKLILDDLGISAKALDAEIANISQRDFGLNAKLTEAQKAAVFTEAALRLAGDAAAKIGEDAGSSIAAFDKLSSSASDLKVTFGEFARPATTAFAEMITSATQTAQKILVIFGAVREGIATVFAGVLDRARTTFSNLGRIIRGEPTEAVKTLDLIFEEAVLAQEERFKQLASTVAGVDFGGAVDQGTKALEDQTNAAELDEDAIKALNAAIQQAEQLQLSFARAAEDAARKQARALEDVERKRGRQLSKLQDREAKDRDNLLKDQIKSLEDFEEDSRKDIAKERQKAAQDRLKNQQKLQRQLQQQSERFNLNQLQSERRFQLSERRLRAEGDILGIQQLREDRELQLKENKENFDQTQKETKTGAASQQREQEKDLTERLDTLKRNLEDQRGELLANFDEQLAQQSTQQQEQRARLQQSFVEQDQDRAISLARQEEDRLISQQRQLEDLGRSLASEKSVTEEGVTAIAAEFEKVFGIEGTADNVITGFTDRTESAFKGLFDNVESIVSGASAPDITTSGINTSGQGLPLFLPGFGDGGVVDGPGPIGSPQPVMAHVGETFLPTHKQSFRMPAPVIPSQRLAVEMSGGFAITGGEAAGEVATQAAVTEIVDTIEIAINRLARRN